ncbi:MAG TPA: peptidylprolyl isomerase [Steroidobacteraceae bacterium]|jgi:hypothetical protein
MSIAREPFFQFIALGALIWSGVQYWTVHHDRYSIYLGPSERQRIAASYFLQFGSMPTAEQLGALIDRYVREEIVLREGLALNLDKGDEIVRRRIIQKFEFLETDLAVIGPPEQMVLERWFEQNAIRYLTPKRVAFSHVYFTADKDGEAATKARASEVLRRLRGMHTSHASDLGDAFPGPSDVGALALDEATRVFGQSELSEQLFKLPIGRWEGPYRSGYGWHLVYITGHLQPHLPQLVEVRERVLSDYLDEQRHIVNERAFEKLRAQYTVSYDAVGKVMIPAKANVIPASSGTD